MTLASLSLSLSLSLAPLSLSFTYAPSWTPVRRRPDFVGGGGKAPVSDMTRRRKIKPRGLGLSVGRRMRCGSDPSFVLHQVLPQPYI